MTFYIRKFFSLVITLFLMSLITFAAFQILPGDPASIILGMDADPLQLEALRNELGLNEPLLTQYLSWFKNALTFNLGESIRFNMPVSELILARIPITTSLTLLTLVFTLLIGIPLGTFVASKDTPSGHVVSTLSQLGMAIPAFWMGIILIMIFSITFSIFPSDGYVPFSENPIEWLKSLFLPSLSMALGTSAILIRYLKTAMQDELPKLYVLVARGKGLSEKKIINKHILKNALIPTITILGMLIVDILGGSIITENVFNLPGLGNLMVTSIHSRDLPLIQGLVLYLGTIVVFFNFLVDILYALIDPRIRIGR
ncbi:MAG: ABC transporter permease [Cellulosilyticaceae bacterium]